MKRRYQSITIAVIAMFIVIASTLHSQAAADGLSRSVPADCGGWSVVPSPGRGQLNGVAAISSSDVWAVGDSSSGGFYQTLVEHWNGTSWSVVPGPNPGTSSAYLFGVTALLSSDVWAVGYYYTNTGAVTLIEHWDGTSWSVVPSPNPGGFMTNQLWGVAAISSSDIWAVGDYSNNDASFSTLVEHWDGTSWSVIPSPNLGDNQLSGVAAISSSDVWAVGYHYTNTGAVTLIEHWDGTSWSVVPSLNLGTGDNWLYGVAALSSSNVWAVGYYYTNNGGNSSTLTEHWDGTSWSVMSSPSPGSYGNRLYGVAVLSSSDVWAVGYYYTNNGGNSSTLVEHWDGTSWSVMSSPSPGSYSNRLYGVAALSYSDVWAVGAYSSVGFYSALTEHHSASGCDTPTPGGPTNTPTITPTPQPTVCPNPFVDINTNIFFHAINSLYCQGVINGTDASHYSPSGTATRGQFAKVVVLAFGLPLTTPQSGHSFSDVPPGYFAYVYIESGYAAHILSGFDQQGCTDHQALYPCYLPNLAITRGQLTKLVVNAGGYPLITPTSGPTFWDVPPSNVFYAFIETAAASHIISGYPDGSFRPNNNIRRDEMAQIVYSGQQSQPASPTPTNTPAPSMTYTPTETATPFATDTPGGPTSTATPVPLPSVTVTPTTLR